MQMLCQKYPGVEEDYRFRDIWKLQPENGKPSRADSLLRALQIDIVIAGFPCQGVSMAGNREGLLSQVSLSVNGSAQHSLFSLLSFSQTMGLGAARACILGR